MGGNLPLQWNDIYNEAIKAGFFINCTNTHMRARTNTHAQTHAHTHEPWNKILMTWYGLGTQRSIEKNFSVFMLFGL